jgi:hypothetical protein
VKEVGKAVLKALVSILLLAFIAAPSLSAHAQPQVRLLIIEHYVRGRTTNYQIPSEDNSNDISLADHYVLLGFHWYTAAKYYINPSNKYGFSADAVVSAITASAYTWDSQTSKDVFSYQGIVSGKNAPKPGVYDGYNVIGWGNYRAGVIAVTYIWYAGDTIVETDTRLNSLYKWSLTGEAGKFDVQDIMTHELGHWCGLGDLYSDADYWLTMYGYADYGETYKRTLGIGDINGLLAVYEPQL